MESRRLTSEPVDGAHVYEVREEALGTGHEGKEVVVNVWEDSYNIEWRTSTGLDQFLETVSDLSQVRPDSETEAWITTAEEVERWEGTYREFLENSELSEYCGNFQVDAGAGRLYWEETKGRNTVEVTSEIEGTELFEELYRETTSTESDIFMDEITGILAERE